jgi:hypothetical protein
MKLKIESIKNEDKTSKNGKPYVACSIKSGGEYYNGFGNAQTKSWQVGDEVEVETYEEEYNGKMYKKFRVPKESEQFKQALEVIVKELRSLKERVSKLEGAGSVEKTEEPTDLPF